MAPTTQPTATTDGLGRAITPVRPPERIVSLVPSLTEALYGMGLAGRIVGRTRYCVEPRGLVDQTPALGGTKNPEIDRIVALAPDLVVASAEENVREHVEALIDAGLTVYVSLPATVRRAIEELRDLALLVDRERQARPWLEDARETVETLERRALSRRRVRYFCPIWRRPYMVAGPDTYMSDLLRLCGGENSFGDGPARYYPVELADVAARAPEVVLLPSEPYPFADKHLPEILSHAEMPAVAHGRVHLIDGQWITWYGPRIAPSLRAVAALFEAV
jgi:ABC-type Fe3+-hydroxamate transport system substrate-binding protein